MSTQAAGASPALVTRKTAPKRSSVAPAKASPPMPATKTVARKASKPVKPSAKAAAKKPAVKSKPAAPAKAKTKLVRDSFTIPKSEFAVLDALKSRGMSLARPVKKSELLRAGIVALKAMNDKAFLDALACVPSLKTGRPKRDKPAAEKS